MGKRKGASTSRERTSSRRESEAKTSEEGVEDERDQLRREISSFEGKRAEVSEKERELETIQRKDKKRKRQEQLTSLRLEVEQAQQNMPAKRKRLKDVCATRKVENTQRLDKLPPEVWEKIFGNLDENDLFPLALSCRYFRQKQEEMGNRLCWRQKKKGSGGKPFFPLETNLRQKLEEGTPASAEYLQFCIEEKSLFLRGKKKGRKKVKDWMSSSGAWLRFMATWLCCRSSSNLTKGNTPLTTSMATASLSTSSLVMQVSFLSHNLFLFFILLTSFSLSLLHSAWRPTGGLEVAESHVRKAAHG